MLLMSIFDPRLGVAYLIVAFFQFNDSDWEGAAFSVGWKNFVQ